MSKTKHIEDENTSIFFRVGLDFFDPTPLSLIGLLDEINSSAGITEDFSRFDNIVVGSVTTKFRQLIVDLIHSAGYKPRLIKIDTSGTVNEHDSPILEASLTVPFLKSSKEVRSELMNMMIDDEVVEDSDMQLTGDQIRVLDEICNHHRSADSKVHIAIESHRTVLITGPSSAGKTSLMDDLHPQIERAVTLVELDDFGSWIDDKWILDIQAVEKIIDEVVTKWSDRKVIFFGVSDNIQDVMNLVGTTVCLLPTFSWFNEMVDKPFKPHAVSYIVKLTQPRKDKLYREHMLHSTFDRLKIAILRSVIDRQEAS